MHRIDERLLKDHHPQQQGLRLQGNCPLFSQGSLKDHHPQQQGLRLEIEDCPPRWVTSKTIIHNNKD